MNAHRIDVLDEAHGNHLVLGVADDFDFKLFPVEDRFFDEALAGERSVKAAHADRAELLDVVAESAAGAAHRVGGTDHHGIADLVLDEIHGLLDRMDDAGARSVDAEALHRGLEHLAVLAALDGVEIDADHLHAVLLEDALLGELHGEVEACLAAEIGKNRVGALLFDDLLETGFVQRLNVGRIGHHRVGHDGGGVGVHQNHLVAASPERLARLSAGIVEFTSLTNDNRPRSDDQNLIHIRALHIF